MFLEPSISAPAGTPLTVHAYADMLIFPLKYTKEHNVRSDHSSSPPIYIQKPTTTN
jgi:hypothetical protein